MGKYLKLIIIFNILIVAQLSAISKPDLTKGVTTTSKSEYEIYINKQAPSEDAFVAVQRLIEPYIVNNEWKEAIETLIKYKRLFLGKDSLYDSTRFDKIIDILDAPFENLTIKNAGNLVNTRADEYNPTLTADELTMYFTGNKRKGGKGDEDIFYSKFNIKTKKWKKAVNLGSTINTKDPEAILSISPNGNRIIIFGNYNDHLGRGDMYYSDLTENGWTEIFHLPSPINSTDYEAGGIITNDNHWFLFNSDRPGGVGNYHLKGNLYHGDYWGNQDIFICEWSESGLDSPINLGSTINTPFAEVSPFLHPDGKTLYFSSDGHSGLGRLDVFYSERLSDTSWTEWSEPINLGKEINSPGNDWGYKISTNGDVAYYSANNNRFVFSSMDIYKILVPIDVRPGEVTTIEGVVEYPDGNPVTGVDIVFENVETGEEIARTKSDFKDGSFSQVIPEDTEQFVARINDPEYFPTSTTPIDVKDEMKLQKVSSPQICESYSYNVTQTTPCLTTRESIVVQDRIKSNIDTLLTHGIRLITEDPNSVLLSWPLQTIDSSYYGYHSVSAFVDHEYDYPDSISDYFCGKRTYDMSSGYNHKGTDIFLWPFAWYQMDNEKVEIIAAAEGTIIYKQDGNFDRSCGLENDSSDWNAVYIEHFDGSIAWYGHMKNKTVTNKNIGEKVERGEYLGVVGSSGSSTGPHLHFELYDSFDELMDPYQGDCNDVKSARWKSQRPYFDSGVNKLMTHSARPIFPDCPDQEMVNAENEFQQGDSVLVAAYYRDQLYQQKSHYKIYRPDNSVFTDWAHTSDSTYLTTYWSWWIQLPVDAQIGTWKFNVKYNGIEYEHDFFVSELPNSILTVSDTKIDDKDEKDDSFEYDDDLKKEKESTSSEKIKLTDNTKKVFLQEPLVTFNINKIDDLPEAPCVPMNNIFFDIKKDELKQESKYALKRLIEILENHPNLSIIIAGHTDSDSTEYYNYQLSQQRADAVLKYMLKSGIKKSSVESIGYGESNLIYKDGVEDKTRSRRVEICFK